MFGQIGYSKTFLFPIRVIIKWINNSHDPSLLLYITDPHLVWLLKPVLLLCWHPPIVPGFSGVFQGLGLLGVHHHIVHTRMAATCTLLTFAGLLAANAFVGATFLDYGEIGITWLQLNNDKEEKDSDLTCLGGVVCPVWRSRSRYSTCLSPLTRCSNGLLLTPPSDARCSMSLRDLKDTHTQDWVRPTKRWIERWSLPTPRCWS